LFPKADLGQMSQYGVRGRVVSALNQVNPAVVAIPGWQESLALGALQWAVIRGRPAVLMSDSHELNGSRHGLREFVKRRIVHLCAAGFVSGSAAADYLVRLGMTRERIFTGYDVVDNDHFGNEAENGKGQSAGIRLHNRLPTKYFLCPGRFIWEKNHGRLLQAYASYLEQARCKGSAGCDRELWHLVLLGDGPLRSEIETWIEQLRLTEYVHLPGFVQYPELPTFYRLASACILPSVSETWGLVVNEAMASGSPVLVSNCCGCVPDLVREGVNGFTFDPLDVERLAGLMLRLTEAPESEIVEMGTVGQQMIKNWSPKTFARNLWEAGSTALVEAQYHVTKWDKLVLRVVSNIGVSPANNGAKC
jgi:1,2-diacylglycerol 3-alpha-glucosyltransferase